MDNNEAHPQVIKSLVKISVFRRLFAINECQLTARSTDVASFQLTSRWGSQ